MKSVLLNNIDHTDLRVITTRSAEYGDAVMYAPTFPDEFRNLQLHYPIVFQKSADGRFQPVALLGFQQEQNLFLTANGWDATYVPLTIQRQPFLIGVGSGEPMMHVDLDSPRVSRTEGEPLFREHGGTTDFLERMSSVLRAIHDGLARTPAFIAALLEYDLLESVALDIQLTNGSQNRLAGFYTIQEENLGKLSGDALEALNSAGHLEAIYMTVASISNFRTLIERQNRLHAADL